MYKKPSKATPIALFDLIRCICDVIEVQEQRELFVLLRFQWSLHM